MKIRTDARENAESRKGREVAAANRKRGCKDREFVKKT